MTIHAKQTYRNFQGMYQAYVVMEKIKILVMLVMFVLIGFVHMSTCQTELGGTMSEDYNYDSVATTDDNYLVLRTPSCRGICDCLSEAMNNNSISPACFRIKGDSSHLIKQMEQANRRHRVCNASGETTRFRCIGDRMACVYFGNKTFLQEDSEEDVEQENFSSFNNETSGGNPAGEDNFNTYVTCERVLVDYDTGLACRIDRNETKPETCNGDSEVKCHYTALKRLDDADKCRPGWHIFKKKCYRYVNELSTFDQTRRRCRGMGAYVVADLEDSVRKLVESQWGNSSQWVKPTPSDVNGTAQCYITDVSGDVTAADCGELHTFSCQKTVFKYLQCKHAPEAQFMETTQEMTTAFESTTERHDLITSPEEKSLEASRVALEQAREEIGDYISKFTNDSSTLDILNTIIAPTPPENDEKDTTAVAKVTEMMEKIDNLVDSLAEVVSGPGEPLTITAPDLVLKVVPFCMKCSSVEPTPRLQAGLKNSSFSIKMPNTSMGQGATVAMSAVSAFDDAMPTNVADDKDNTITDGEDTKNMSQVVEYQISSLVATISLKRWDGGDINLSELHPFEVTFTNKKVESVQTDASTKSDRSCCYWRPDETGKSGSWSTKGCIVSRRNDSHTTCQCTHLTSFAVLMRVSKAGAPQSLHATKAQDYMTYVGCGLSMACLVTMLLIFTVQKLYRSDRNVIHMNLAFALLVSQAVFLFGIDKTEPWQLCKTIGVCLHFFLISTFFWMLVEGIFLISKTTSTKNRFLKVPTYVAVGWGGPVLVVGTTAAISFKSYGTEEICWLTVDDGGIWAFVAPAVAIVVANVVLLCQVIRVFLSLRTNMKKAHVERLWLSLRAMLLTLPLLGSTWLFGMLSFNTKTVFFSYIFIVLNSLQGVFIFVLYCVLNDEVKKVVEKKLSSIGRISGRTSNGRSTRSTT